MSVAITSDPKTREDKQEVKCTYKKLWFEKNVLQLGTDECFLCCFHPEFISLNFVIYFVLCVFSFLFCFLLQMEPIDPQKLTCTSVLTTATTTTTAINSNVLAGNDPRSPTTTIVSAAISSMGTSREDEDDSSNQNSSDCKSPGNR